MAYVREALGVCFGLSMYVFYMHVCTCVYRLLNLVGMNRCQKLTSVCLLICFSALFFETQPFLDLKLAISGRLLASRWRLHGYSGSKFRSLCKQFTHWSVSLSPKHLIFKYLPVCVPCTPLTQFLRTLYLRIKPRKPINLEIFDFSVACVLFSPEVFPFYFETDSHYCNPHWPWTCYIAQAALHPRSSCLSFLSVELQRTTVP